MLRKRLALGLILILMVVLAAGCAASTSKAQDGRGTAEYSGPMTAEMPAPSSAAADEALAGGIKNSTEEAGNVNLEADPNRKRIRTGDLQLESLEFDQSLKALDVLLAKVGGYIESSDITGVSSLSTGKQALRSAQFTVRVPAAQFDAFLSSSGDIGNVLNTTTNSQDITDQYFDTEARLASQKMMEERLLTLLSKSDKLTDIISLEQSLADVRYQIESLTGTLRKWDSMVDYGTLNIHIQEVVKITEEEPFKPEPETLGGKLWVNFVGSLKDVRDGFFEFIVFLAGALPYLVVWGVIIAALTILFIRVRRARRRKAPAVAEKKNPPVSSEEQKPEQK